MKKLVRIVYVSRSTFAPGATQQGVEPNIARILAKSRSNNRRNGLVGVLYFGNGCFFQCLEGEEEAVDTLYGKLEIDPRHRELKLISREYIEHTSFGAWTMKYIPTEKKILALLLEEGLSAFDPYQFSPAGIQKMLTLLQEAEEPLTAADSGSKPVQVPEAPQTTPVKSAPPSASKGWSRTVIALALAALVLCALALKYALR